jgi:hypothetical protein
MFATSPAFQSSASFSSTRAASRAQWEIYRAQAFRAEQAQGLADARASTQISSVALATQLRLDPFITLEPMEGAAMPIRLVEQEGSRKELVQTALGGRPELLRERYLQSAAQTRREAAAKISAKTLRVCRVWRFRRG